MTAAAFWRQLARESRGSRGRLAFFIACLAVGVAAVVSVAGLIEGIETGLRGEARQLLAADLMVEGLRPLPASAEAVLATLPGAERATIRELVTLVAAPAPEPAVARSASEQPGRSQLVELKAVSEGYPFYGSLTVEPDRPPTELLAEGVLAAPELLSRLQLEVGDQVLLGGKPFRIAGALLAEPDRIAGAFSLGPRLLVSLATLEASGLERFGSRIERRELVRLPGNASAEEAKAVAEKVKAALSDPTAFRVETFAEAQPMLRQGLRRAERFLGLVALLSLLIGGIGVAQTVRAWLAGRLDAIAILKCLGMRPREILGLYLGQTALLGLAGSVAGALAGIAVQRIVPALLGDLLPRTEIATVQPLAILRGLVLGVGIALLFSLPPLIGLRRIPAARVLRRTAEPLPASRPALLTTAVILALGIAGTASLQAASLVMGLLFAGGVALAAALLAAAAWLLTRAVGSATGGAGSGRRRLRVAWRYGLASLARPGAATLGGITSLGLGVLVVLAMSLVQRQLAAQLHAELPSEAPTAFLLDIQPRQWPGVQEELTHLGASRIDSVPIVMARLAKVDGRPTAEIASTASPEERDRRWALTREQRLTYLERLPEDNQIVAGALWSDPQQPEVSVEEEFAGELGVKLGSRLVFDLQGVPLELVVTSLRRVRWETFGINFFLVVEPGVLEEAPQFRLAAARLPRGGEQGLQDSLAASYPNVVVLRIRDVLEKVAAVLAKIGLGVRFLGGFTVLAGVAILAGAVAAAAARRGREVALLKTLGMSRAQVVGVFAIEHALVGLLAGLLGAASGGVLAWAVLTRGMGINWSFETLPYLVAVAGTVLLATTAGLAAGLPALLRRPLESLRHEE